MNMNILQGVETFHFAIPPSWCGQEQFKESVYKTLSELPDIVNSDRI